MMNASALDNTGNNNSYTHSHGTNLRDQPVNSIGLQDHTGGEAFMECNYNVSLHDSNNNEYIYMEILHICPRKMNLLKKMSRRFAKALCSYQQLRLSGQRPVMWLQ